MSFIFDTGTCTLHLAVHQTQASVTTFLTMVSGELNVVDGLKLTNQTNCRFWKKFTFNWLVDNPSQDAFGQRPQWDSKGAIPHRNKLHK
jgi:hypothetical protein